MDPQHAIAPTQTVRRAGTNRWHLHDTTERHYYSITFCGQRIRNSEHGTAYNAEQVTCTDCLVSAISRGDTGRPAYA